MAEVIQLAKDLLKGGNKEDIYPKTVDTAVAAETVEGEESTVDQVYLKTANLEGLVNDLPVIEALVDHKEPKILSVEVTSDSTVDKGTILVNSLTLNGSIPGIEDINRVINFILGDYNIKLQLYKYNTSGTAKIVIDELDMCVYGSGGNKAIVGYKFLAKKKVLIIEGIVDMMTAAATGQGTGVPYEAVSLDNIHVVLIDFTIIDGKNVGIFVDSLGHEIDTMNFSVLQNWIENGDTVILRQFSSHIDFHLSTYYYETSMWFSRAMCKQEGRGFIQTLYLSRTNPTRFSIRECDCYSLTETITEHDNFKPTLDYDDLRRFIEDKGVNMMIKVIYNNDSDTYILTPDILGSDFIAFSFNTTVPAGAGNAVGYYLKEGNTNYLPYRNREDIQ